MKRGHGMTAVVSLTAFVLVIGIAVTTGAIAEIIHVPLPGLTGPYTVSDMSRTTTFDLGYPLEAVNGAWIHWSGTITPGFGCGDGDLRPVDDCFPWDCELSCRLDEPSSGFWYAHAGPADGGFDETTQFQDFLSPGWDFLLDGASSIRVDLEPYIVIGGVMIVPPEATIEAAVLIIDADITVPAIEATVRFEPGVLNLRSRGRWVTCFIELPEGYSPGEINIATVVLNDSLHAETHPSEVGDHDGDGIPDLMVKFSRPGLIEMLETACSTEVCVVGEVDGQAFSGSDAIGVLSVGLYSSSESGSALDKKAGLRSDAQSDPSTPNRTTWGRIKAEFGE